MRDNLYVGELEVELGQPEMGGGDQSGTGRRNSNAGLGQFSNFILALQDNQGKAIKRKSLQIMNFFKNKSFGMDQNMP